MESQKILQNKILSGDNLDRMLSYWHFKNKKIVFTNGCFDILHFGHIDYLSKARELGDILILGLNTDSSVQRLKGPERPINNEISRASMLASFFFIDAVVLFDEQTPYELIKRVQPDILVKGSDYKAEDIVGYDIVKARNGEVITLDFIPGYSTTGLIEKIKSC